SHRALQNPAPRLLRRGLPHDGEWEGSEVPASRASPERSEPVSPCAVVLRLGFARRFWIPSGRTTRRAPSAASLRCDRTCDIFALPGRHRCSNPLEMSRSRRILLAALALGCIVQSSACWRPPLRGPNFGPLTAFFRKEGLPEVPRRTDRPVYRVI